jgi:pre-mRNA-processing factor 39
MDPSSLRLDLANDAKNFDKWTQLVTAVEQLDDLDQIQDAILGLVKEFPLCFGYWKRLAMRLQKAGLVEKAFAILENGVHATPHSHQLWTHYCSETAKLGDAARTRALFQRAADIVGTDYQAKPFWDNYLEFETSEASKTQNFGVLNQLYLRILRIPNADLAHFYSQFQSFAAAQSVDNLVIEEDNTQFDLELAKQAEAVTPPVTELTSEARKSIILKNRESIFHATMLSMQRLSQFESVIAKRTFFHVKPLDLKDLTTWEDYLSLVDTNVQADASRLPSAIKTYERCLVVTALYPKFWVRYCNALEKWGRVQQARENFQKATTLFCPSKADLFLEYAAFEERQSQPDASRILYDKIVSEIAPGLLKVVYHHPC